MGLHRSYINIYEKQYESIMTILVTGDSGFIGSAFVESAKNLKLAKLGAGVRLSGIGENSAVVLESLAKSDVVLHLAGLAHGCYTEDQLEIGNTLVTSQLASDAAKSGVRRFVYLSSVNVHDVLGETIITERSNVDWCDSRAKAEKELLEIAEGTGMEVTIIRSVLVYGKGAPGNIGLIEKYISALPITPFGALTNSKSFISIENLCEILKICCIHPKAKNEVFLIADEKPASTPQLISHLASRNYKKVYHCPIPLALIRFAGRVLGKSKLVDLLLMDSVVDASKVRLMLSWKPENYLDYSVLHKEGEENL